LNEQRDFIRRELDAAEREVRQGLDPAAEEANPETLVCEQPLDGEVNHALRHGGPKGKRHASLIGALFAFAMSGTAFPQCPPPQGDGRFRGMPRRSSSPA
jgi:hypothetical protein